MADFEYEGFTHILVVPSAFPTVAMHTMYDVSMAAVGRPVLPVEGIVEHERSSGMKVYCSALGVADLENGRELYRSGLDYLGRIAVMEALEKTPDVRVPADIRLVRSIRCASTLDAGQKSPATP